MQLNNDRLKEVLKMLGDHLYNESKNMKDPNLAILPAMVKETVPIYAEIARDNPDKTEILFDWIVDAVLYALGENENLPELNLNLKIG